MSWSRTDKLFFISLLPSAIIVTGLLGLFLFVVLIHSWDSILAYGARLFVESVWNPEKELYGILSPIIGTLLTSLIATCTALVFSVSLSIFVVEYLNKRVQNIFVPIIELMGGVPTIVYAIWALHYLVPFMKASIMEPLHKYLGFIPLFSCQPTTGFSILIAGIAIGIPLIPYTTSIIVESYKLVPLTYKEACFGIGATKYELVKVMLAIIKPAIIASAILSFARASGETTIAVTTVGNAMSTSVCIIGPGYTVPALLASQYANANLYQYAESVLYAAALTILLLTLVLSFIGLRILEKWRVRIVV
ncbi:MAG: phosphate ABC transporter permease subunit PstC [Desulfurococcaceae archaeon]